MAWALRITAIIPSWASAGQFGHAYRLDRDPTYVDNRLGTAHNFYLNTLAETGIVGAAVALALGVRVDWRLVAALAARRDDDRASCIWRARWRRWSVSARRVSSTPSPARPLALLALGLAAYCVTETRTRIDPPLRGSRPAAVAA